MAASHGGSGTSDELFRLEDHKHQLAKALEDYKDSLLQRQEIRKSVADKRLALWRILFDYAQISIRAILTVNGLGATAIIAFMGNALKEHATDPPFTLQLLGAAAAIFAFGVAAGVLATVFAYFSQFDVHLIFENHGGKDGFPHIPSRRWKRTAAILAIFAGLAAFLTGVMLAISAFVLAG